MAFNLSRHLRAAYRWGANLNVFPVVGEEDPVKVDLLAFFSVQTVDENQLVFFYLVLVPCDLYDCIHDSIINPKRGGAKVGYTFQLFNTCGAVGFLPLLVTQTPRMMQVPARRC